MGSCAFKYIYCSSGTIVALIFTGEVLFLIVLWGTTDIENVRNGGEKRRERLRKRNKAIGIRQWAIVRKTY